MANFVLSRRHLLKAATGATACGVIGSTIPRSLLALTPESAAAGLYGAEMEEAELRKLLNAALNAAKDSGAQFCDVRINQAVHLSFFVHSSAGADVFSLLKDVSIGVRAVVDGAWGFAGGDNLTPATVSAMAQLAVARAKAAGGGQKKPFEFAAAPVVKDGRWQTPVDIDPFTVPIGEQETLFMRAAQDAQKVKGTYSILGSVQWTRARRAFASSEGSFILQTIVRGGPSASARARSLSDPALSCGASAEFAPQEGAGYEQAARGNLQQAWPRAVEEAVRLASMPVKSVDVGRYDLVLGAGVVADALARTIGRALELDRALGEKANGAGTTYAMPPAEIIGKYRVGNEQLTLSCDRSRPKGGTTVGWDEEGVRPEEFVLVDKGVVNDFITTRRTAPALEQWYRSHDRTPRSHGCATRSGDRPPMLQLPNMTLKPGAAPLSVEDLIKGVKRGFYVVSAEGGVDHQCLNAQYAGRQVREIRDGKLLGLTRDMAFQFNTAQFWKSLDALGGAASASSEDYDIDDMPTLNAIDTTVHCVPARFRGINVINTGKQA